MAAETVIQIAQLTNVAKANNVDSRGDILARIKSRRSKEIIIGLAGAVGCNLGEVLDEIKNQFTIFGYEVRTVKVSSIIKAYFEKNPLPAKHQGVDLSRVSAEDRYRILQDLGNEMRRGLGLNVLATLAIKEISIGRELQIAENDSGAGDPPRTVYLIDQLKNPAEVELLKEVYKNVFYLVGVLSPEESRIEQLKQEGIGSVSAQELVERDRNEDHRYGQRLEKTIQYADYFIRHRLGAIKVLSKPCERFAKLVHGSNGITPTRDESGMYAAHSASLKSACLSRQVGAAIANKKGSILSLGWNDVPMAGGGLYTADVEDNDKRCVHLGRKCYNDYYKRQLSNSVVSAIKGLGLKLNEDDLSAISDVVVDETPVGSLIEYSRAIHAEMEAILNLARTEGASTHGATLYSTTYPCHNCARHIIASGIDRVVYIEPYEKSLATTLHFDAISKDKVEAGKVLFENFEGVSPRRYAAFFAASKERKDEAGNALQIIAKSAPVVSSEILDSYIDVEGKVVERAVELFPEGA